MASDGPAADYSQATENADRWGHSGFLQFDDGSLDHLAVAEDRVELDLFDDGRWLLAWANATCSQT